MSSPGKYAKRKEPDEVSAKEEPSAEATEDEPSPTAAKKPKTIRVYQKPKVEEVINISPDSSPEKAKAPVGRPTAVQKHKLIMSKGPVPTILVKKPVVAAVLEEKPTPPVIRNEEIFVDDSAIPSTSSFVPKPQPTTAKPNATKQQKFVLTVSKSLYKEYKDGKIDLKELTARSRKIEKHTLTKSVPQAKQPRALPPGTAVKQLQMFPSGARRYRFPKPSKPLEHITEVLNEKTDPKNQSSSPPRPFKELHRVEKQLNTPEVSAQAHQVAPNLFQKAIAGEFKLQNWHALIPSTNFRDWPVPASVLFSAAVQLKQNYQRFFNLNDRVEIEGVLHMVGHYPALGGTSKSFIRERVNFYLKKIQAELIANKPKKTRQKKLRMVPVNKVSSAVENVQQVQEAEENEFSEYDA